MSPSVATNIGVDNKTCVDIGNEIIEHAKLKATTVLRTQGGAPLLGGRKTKLHQMTANRRPWQLVKNGDLWSHLQKAVKANNPETVKFAKQNGHATQQKG